MPGKQKVHPIAQRPETKFHGRCERNVKRCHCRTSNVILHKSFLFIDEPTICFGFSTWRAIIYNGVVRSDRLRIRGITGNHDLWPRTRREHFCPGDFNILKNPILTLGRWGGSSVDLVIHTEKDNAKRNRKELNSQEFHTFSLTILLIGPWICSRCFFKDGSSSTPWMEFRMVTHMQGSTVSNLKFQCMTSI